MRKPKLGEIWELKDTTFVVIVISSNEFAAGTNLQWIAKGKKVDPRCDWNVQIDHYADDGTYKNNRSGQYDLAKYIGIISMEDTGGVYNQVRTGTECKHTWKPTTITKNKNEWCVLCGVQR